MPDNKDVTLRRKPQAAAAKAFDYRGIDFLIGRLEAILNTPFQHPRTPKPLRRKATPAAGRIPLQLQIDFSASALAASCTDEIAAIAASVRRRFRLPASDEPDLFQHGYIAAIQAGFRYTDGRFNSSSYWKYAAAGIRFAMSDFASGRQGEVRRRAVRRSIREGTSDNIVSFTPSVESNLPAVDPPDPACDRLDSATHVLDQLFDGMDPRQTRIIRMKHIEQKSNSEIGCILGLKSTSVAVEAAEAMAVLRAKAESLGNVEAIADVLNR